MKCNPAENKGSDTAEGNIGTCYMTGNDLSEFQNIFVICQIYSIIRTIENI